MIRRTLKLETEWVIEEDDKTYYLFIGIWGFAFLPISGLNEGCPYDNRYDEYKIDTGQKLKGGWN